MENKYKVNKQCDSISFASKLFASFFSFTTLHILNTRVKDKRLFVYISRVLFLFFSWCRCVSQYTQNTVQRTVARELLHQNIIGVLANICNRFELVFISV